MNREKEETFLAEFKPYELHNESPGSNFHLVVP